MRTFRLGGPAALQAALLQGAVIDALVDARNGLPAVVPAPQPAQTGAPPTGTGTGLLPFLTMGVAAGSTLPPATYTGTWSGAVTTTPGSTASFTFVGVGAQLVLAGNPTSGGIAWVTLDGSPRLAMDTAATMGQAAQSLLCPTGGVHTVAVTYYGDIAAGVTPVGAPVNTVGTSVAPLLGPQRVNRGATTAATWTIAQVTDSTHVSINGSGSYALGTTVTGVIPGVSLVLALGTLTTGDAATIATAATGISILALNVATQEATDAGWTSPVVSADGTALTLSGSGIPTVIPLPLPDPVLNDRTPLQWLALAWEEDPASPCVAGWAATGNTINPQDAAWSVTPAATGFRPDQLAISHDGLGNGIMGLAVLPRGAYCRASVRIPQYGYFRNPRLYAWDPDNDPDARRFPPVPGRETQDDLAQRLYGALAVGWAVLERDPLRELLASTSPGAAVGALLDRHGAERTLPRPYGLDDGTYARLLRFLSAARTRGGTTDFYRQALGLLLGPTVPFSVQSLAGTTQSWVLGTSRLGVDTVLGSVTPNAWTAQISITVRALALPPATVQQVITAFAPAFVNLVWVWS